MRLKKNVNLTSVSSRVSHDSKIKWFKKRASYSLGSPFYMRRGRIKEHERNSSLAGEAV